MRSTKRLSTSSLVLIGALIVLAAGLPGQNTGTLEGRIEFGAIDRAPSNRVMLLLVRAIDAEEGELHQIRPDQAGRFRIDDLSVGTYEVCANVHDPHYRKFNAWNRVHIESGKSTPVLLRTPTGQAELRVISKKNPPYVLALVPHHAQPPLDEVKSKTDMTRIQRYLGQKSGSRDILFQSNGSDDFRVETLEPGNYQLLCIASDWQRGDPPMALRALPITLRENHTTTVELLDALRVMNLLEDEARTAAMKVWEDIVDNWRTKAKRQGIVGSSLMLGRRQQRLSLVHHGHQDAKRQTQVNDQTIYHWASCTKTLTGIAVMQLVERGLIELDDPVTRYVPELRTCHNPHGSMDDITIRHLLSHSGGFRAPTWPFAGDKSWQPHEPTEWSQLKAMFPYTEILFPPGSRFSYSNPGIVFLGRTIEELTGDDYEVAITKDLLMPIGMTSAYFDRTPHHLLPHRSDNFRIRDGKTTPEGLDFDTGITVSNGGLNAPLPDMARYLAHLAAVAQGETGIVTRNSLKTMWTPVVSTSPDRSSTSMGLTFFLYEAGEHRYVGHTGGQKNFVTFFLLDPSTGVYALGAFNTLGGPAPGAGSLSAAIQRRVQTELFPLFTR